MDKYEKAVLSDKNIGLIDPKEAIKEAKMKAHKKSTIESESDGDEVLSDENIGFINPKEAIKEARMKAYKKSAIESESDGDENQSVEKLEHPRSLKKEFER